MYNNKKFLAIIPARSGSKGLKDKNIKKINGKPLLSYTIESAKLSGIFDDIIVSTDSEEYALLANKYGARTPFLRPNHLATDDAKSIDVIEHTLIKIKQLGEKYDFFMLLQPTSPLRSSEDIINATNLLFKKNAMSIVSVCESEHSPMLMNTLDSSLNINNFIGPDNNKRRQDLPIYYRLNGAIYLSCIEYFLNNKSFYGPDSYAFVMSQLNSIDIDSNVDFYTAENLLKNQL